MKKVLRIALLTLQLYLLALQLYLLALQLYLLALHEHLLSEAHPLANSRLNSLLLVPGPIERSPNSPQIHTFL